MVSDRYSRDQHNVLHLRKAPAVPAAQPLLYMVPAKSKPHATPRYQPVWIVRLFRIVAAIEAKNLELIVGLFLSGVAIGLLIALVLS